MDSLRAARYPFLKEAAEFARNESEGLEALLSSSVYAEARKRGLNRVLGAIKDHTIPETSVNSEFNRLMEVLSYPYARILVSCIDDRMLTKRYALAEAEHLSARLSKDPDSINIVSEECEMNVRYAGDEVEIHFGDFLRYSYVMKAVEWNLINMDIHDGYVTLTREKYIRVVQNAYRQRIESELPLKVDDTLKKAVKPDTNLISLSLNEMKARLSPTGGGEMKQEFLPPCIRAIIAMAQEGQNLPHSARFALVSYLHTLGLDYQHIVAIFAVSPDFNESVSEYQIKHITGELNGTDGYTPPECSTMRTNGICFNPDPLCDKINHPLNYYRIKSGSRRHSGPQ